MENQLEYVDNQLTATIDNETQHIDVYKIIKIPTQFYIDKNIDTVLGRVIELEAFLNTIEDEPKPVPEGIVSINITSLSGRTIYLEKTEYFTKGEIKTSLTNTLPLGLYLLNIDYAGNKFYENTLVTLQFLVDRKTAKCIFDKEYYEEYPNQMLNVGIRLLDTDNNKPISNCVINYSFNSFEYLTQTDSYGFANLIVKTPPIDENKCVTNLQYPLEVYIENSNYRLISEAIAYVVFKKYDTNLIYTITSNNNELEVTGNVYGYDNNNNMVNVDYGTIDFNISNFNDVTKYNVDSNGRFHFVQPITQTEDAHIQPTEAIMFSTPKVTNITVDLPDGTTLKRNYVQKHHMKFVATVTTQDIIVPYGMVTFIIMQNYDEIYRYVTELNNNGEAFFYFDVSTVGEYQIKAKYHSIFDYKESISDIQTYTIED